MNEDFYRVIPFNELSCYPKSDFMSESNRINYHLLSLVKDVIKPNPEVHSGAITEPWIQPENPTLVIDEVPSRQSNPSDPRPTSSVTKLQ